MEIRFVFKSPSGKPRVHAKRLPVVVGRCDSEEVRLRIPIDSVSRRHCEFFLDDKGIISLRDLGSTNGTLLNGKELAPKKSVAVSSGSSVKVGTVVFRVEFKAARNDPDADTMGFDDASEPPFLAKATTEPAAARPIDDHNDDVEMDDEASASPSAGGFAFLGAASSRASEDEAEEAKESEQPAAAGDDSLEDFFKGLK